MGDEISHSATIRALPLPPKLTMDGFKPRMPQHIS